MISKKHLEDDINNLIIHEFPDEYVAEFTWNGSNVKAAKGLVDKEKEIEGGYIQEYEFSLWLNISKLSPLPESGKDTIDIDGITYLIANTSDDNINIRLDLVQEVQAL